MEEQYSGRPKIGWVKIIIINVVVSALVALAVSFVVFGSLANRVSALEQKMDKLTSKFIVK